MLLIVAGRLLVEEAEKALDETRHRLARREKALQKQEERCASLEDQLTHTQHNLAVQRDELSAMRATLAAVDREKDSLQMSVDDKTEKVSMLNAELNEKVGLDFRGTMVGSRCLWKRR